MRCSCWVITSMRSSGAMLVPSIGERWLNPVSPARQRQAKPNYSRFTGIGRPPNSVMRAPRRRWKDAIDMYAPVVKSAKRLHEFILDANHSAVLLGDIVSDAERGPDVGYRFLMVVFDRRWKDPVAFI